MMPIFFNLESHLWIAYTLILNGWLLNSILLSRLFLADRFLKSLEAHVVFAFITSVGLNFLILWGLNVVGLSWSVLAWGLPAISVIFFLVAWIQGRLSWSIFGSPPPFFRVCVYLFVFYILFVNGGLIEQVSDAWWHLSLANELALNGSLADAQDHLTGVPGREYPSLWHANLALIKRLSGEGLPTIWNSATAWIGLLKIMAFYLFSFALTGSAGVATMSCVLFFLLPGVGPSLHRVSAWPSHVSYLIMYTSLAVIFSMLRRSLASLKLAERSVASRFKLVLLGNLTEVIYLCWMCFVIFCVHRVELLWLFLSLFAFLLLLVVTPSVRMEVGPDWFKILSDLHKVLLLLAIAGALAFALKNFAGADSISELILPYLLPVAILIAFFSITRVNAKISIYTLYISIIVLSLVSIDYTHFFSLFVPELALEGGAYNESHLTTRGYFGELLAVPGWHLQLREGLLFSGTLSLPISWFLVARKRNVARIFLASNVTLSTVLLSSGYLYHWAQEVLNYHSVWRVAVLVFSPVVFAVLLYDLVEGYKRWVSFACRRVIYGIFGLGVVVFLAWQSIFHFDRELIEVKRQNKSAQRNWNINYGQRYVYYDSSMRYQKDFEALSKILKPKSVVFSDISTSYYAAASLPVYIRNIHRHHGLNRMPLWSDVLKESHWCYLDIPARRAKIDSFLEKSYSIDIINRGMSARYLIINKDQDNLNMKNDCLSQRRSEMYQNLGELASLVYDGEFLMVFELP